MLNDPADGDVVLADWAFALHLRRPLACLCNASPFRHKVAMHTRHWIAAAALLALIAPAGAAESPYAGEIMMTGHNYCPDGWADADGRKLSIADYPDLYAAIGTAYGGDGAQTFALPDLTGRIPVGQGTAEDGATYAMGETGAVLEPFPDFGEAAMALPDRTHEYLAMRYCVALK